MSQCPSRVTTRTRPPRSAVHATAMPPIAYAGQLEPRGPHRVHRHEHRRDERELPHLDAAVEREKRRRHVVGREAELRERPREAEPVHQAEEEGDEPRRAVREGLPRVRWSQRFHRHQHDADAIIASTGAGGRAPGPGPRGRASACARA